MENDSPLQEDRPLKVLLVEDSSADARLIEIMLKQSHADVELVHTQTLRQALEALSDQQFDCAMVDLGLPDGQGLENIQRIHSMEPALPVAVLTGLSDEKTAEGAIKQGALKYIVKGSYNDGNQLLDLIKDTVALSWFEGQNPHKSSLSRNVSPDDALCIDSTGVITHWGQSAKRVYQYEAEEIVGEHIDKLIPDENTDEIKLILQRLAQKESGFELKSRHVRKDGQYRDIRVIVSPITNPAGEVEGSAWVSRDITESNKTEAATRQLDAIMQHAPMTIIAANLEGDIYNWSSGAEQLLGYKAEDVLGRNIKGLVSADVKDQFGSMISDVRSGNVISAAETLMLARNGEEKPASLYLSPLRDRDGGMTGICLIAMTAQA